MNHEQEDRIDSLFSAARDHRPNTEKIENHFEARLMAKIRERRSDGACWMSWIWRLVPVFAAMAVALIITNVLMEVNRSPDIVAAIFNSDESRCIVNDLTGG